jgi:hypothetical protein
MNIEGLSVYILIWPFVSATILLLLCVALTRDLIAARRDGTDLI